MEIFYTKRNLLTHGRNKTGFLSKLSATEIRKVYSVTTATVFIPWGRSWLHGIQQNVEEAIDVNHLYNNRILAFKYVDIIKIIFIDPEVPIVSFQPIYKSLKLLEALPKNIRHWLLMFFPLRLPRQSLVVHSQKTRSPTQFFSRYNIFPSGQVAS